MFPSDLFRAHGCQNIDFLLRAREEANQDKVGEEGLFDIEKLFHREWGRECSWAHTGEQQGLQTAAIFGYLCVWEGWGYQLSQWRSRSLPLPGCMDWHGFVCGGTTQTSATPPALAAVAGCKSWDKPLVQQWGRQPFQTTPHRGYLHWEPNKVSESIYMKHKVSHHHSCHSSLRNTALLCLSCHPASSPFQLTICSSVWWSGIYRQ